MNPVSVPSIPAASFPLPPRLEGLRRLAYNLRWAWDPRTRNLWSLIDRTAWTRYRNPIPVISGPTEWSRLLDDEKFLAEYHDVLDEFDRYMADGSGHWFQRKHGDKLAGPIAYFCAEYGIHESLGIYSGGLGVLAGDHMKSASDMALPFLGVGLLYRKGYFRQSIDADGHQEHNYPDYDLSRLPLSRVQDAEGLPLTVELQLPGRRVAVAVDRLAEVAVAVQQADPHQRQGHVAGRLHVVAGEDTEAAGVDAQRLVQPVLGAEVGDRALQVLGVTAMEPVVRAIGHVPVELGDDLLGLDDEVRVVEEGRPVDHARQDRDRAVDARPHAAVDSGEQCPHLGVPRPVQVVGEAPQTLELGRDSDVARRRGRDADRGLHSGANDIGEAGAS